VGLLIRNGTIVTADSVCRADVYAAGETVTRIGTDLETPPDTEVIDAAGKLVFPGFIDPHVHVYLPIDGGCAKDTHESASIAALAGGTTTYIEMCGPSRREDALAGYETWKSKAEGHSACDYSFHMTASRFDAETEGQLREIVADGISSFKIYFAYGNAFGVTDAEAFRILTLARALGVVTAAHCENADVVALLQQRLLAAGRRGAEWHEPSRPAAVEAEGTGRFASLLESTGARGYVVHLTCERALASAMAARARGVPIHVESVVPHLLLDKTCAERPGVEGLKHVLSPPLRDRANHQPLWNALATGAIDTVATDHCPFDTAQKLRGEADFTKIPNGMPGIEERVNLLWTYGVKRGRLDLHRFVDAASTRAARIFGLFPRKGTIAPGADADLVVYDPEWRGTISAAAQHGKGDYNGYEGFAVEGRPDVVTVRGKVQVRGGAFVGEKGRGKFLRRVASEQEPVIA
jgi:dihydropyrimidinase